MRQLLIRDRHASYQYWKPREAPVYLLLVTLEDWYVFGKISEAVDRFVRASIGENQLELGLLERYPYAICSVRDFEVAAQLMARRTIREVMSKKTQGEARSWEFHSAMIGHFRADFPSLKGNLFQGELDAL